MTIIGIGCSSQVPALTAAPGSLLHCCQGNPVNSMPGRLRKYRHFYIRSPTPSSVAGVSACCGGDRRFSTYLWLVARHLLLSKILFFSSLYYIAY